MPSVTENQHSFYALLSEANNYRSRKSGVIASGQTLLAGTALGQLTANDEYVQWAPGGSDGSEDFGGVLMYDVDTSAGAVESLVIVRDAEVREDGLVFGGSVTPVQQATFATLAEAAGVIVRDSV